MSDTKFISISIVSHNQSTLVSLLLEDLQNAYKAGFTNFEVIIRLNLYEKLDINSYSFRVIKFVNDFKKGFGCNHNLNFEKSSGDYFLVCNPDIRIPSDSFNVLFNELSGCNSDVVVPVVYNSSDQVEDSIRKFPTFFGTCKRFLGFQPSSVIGPINVFSTNYWAGGMFICFKYETYRTLAGFDERFFMYYEDVDMFKRLHEAQMSVQQLKSLCVIHDAQRGSRKVNYLMFIHIFSALKYFFKWRHKGV